MKIERREIDKMKPLTESDGHTLVINTQIEGYKSTPKFRQFKVFYKEDVLSAVGLLKEKVRGEINNPYSSELRVHLAIVLKWIDECFQIKEVKGR